MSPVRTSGHYPLSALPLNLGAILGASSPASTKRRPSTVPW